MLSLPWNHGKAVLPFHLRDVVLQVLPGMESLAFGHVMEKRRGHEMEPILEGNQTVQIYSNFEGFPKKKCIVWVGNILISDKKKERKLFFA